VRDDHRSIVKQATAFPEEMTGHHLADKFYLQEVLSRKG
jgi:hypothetical protein